MFFFHPYFYGLTILLQAFCVWHCVRRGSQQWIWIIIFLPVIGSVVYLLTEVFTGNGVPGAGSSLFRSGPSIGRMEKDLKFSDTFANRIRLAAAYARTGDRPRAIALFESCLDGPFQDNEQVWLQLIPLYFDEGRFGEVTVLGKKVRKLPEFRSSRAHLLYARALGQTGDTAAAEAEYAAMQGRYSQFEARYYYALFLQKTGRAEEARQLLGQLVEEGAQLTGYERRSAREWVGNAKEALKAAGR